jgi:hypothetical protein
MKRLQDQLATMQDQKANQEDANDEVFPHERSSYFELPPAPAPPLEALRKKDAALNTPKAVRRETARSFRFPSWKCHQAISPFSKPGKFLNGFVIRA